MTPTVRSLSSRANPLLKQVRRVVQDPAGYRRHGWVWLEGEHLCQALLARGGRPAQALVAASAWAQPAWRALAEAAPCVNLVDDELFADVSGLESPPPLAFLLDLPAPPAVQPDQATVVLDRVQDAGNVGTVLRSAAAFGIGQVLALPGTAALWSPKVLRAGMGAHFGLRLREGVTLDELAALQVPLVATTPHAGALLPQTALPQPCAWVLGHEGQGVAPALLQRCALQVRIPQPGGQESLNVAAAAAICFYEAARQAPSAHR